VRVGQAITGIEGYDDSTDAGRIGQLAQLRRQRGLSEAAAAAEIEKQTSNAIWKAVLIVLNIFKVLLFVFAQECCLLQLELLKP